MSYISGGGGGTSTGTSGSAVGGYYTAAFNNATGALLSHNFGAYPVIQVMDTNGNVFVPYSIVNTNSNSSLITFSTTMSGNAFASVGAPGSGAGFYVLSQTDGTMTNSKVLKGSGAFLVLTDATNIYVSYNDFNDVSTGFVINTVKPLSGGTTFAGTGLWLYADTAFLANTNHTLTAGSGTTVIGSIGSSLYVSVNASVRENIREFYFPGNLAGSYPGITTMPTKIYTYFRNNEQIVDFRMAVGVAPTGTNLTIEPIVYVGQLTSGTGLYNPTSRPVLVATAFVGSSRPNGLMITSITAGSWLGIAIAGSGSTLAGSGLSVTLITRTS